VSGRRGPEGWRIAARLAASLVLVAACNGPARRLEAANTARHAGHPREALQGYQAVLAELGEGQLSPDQDLLRRHALRFAADVSYLELGEFTPAVAYYRRIVALYPGTEAAWSARAITGEIYRDRFHDSIAAITQWADIAASDAPEAATYQLKVAREYLELKNWDQARTEARILRERWPTGDLADEAQLLTAQAWALEKRPDEAQRAFQALLDHGPKPELAARALEGQAGLAAEQGKLDRAIELYTKALPNHPNPETIQMAIDSVKTRRDRSRPSGRPGDRATAFDHNVKVRERNVEAPPVNIPASATPVSPPPVTPLASSPVPRSPPAAPPPAAAPAKATTPPPPPPPPPATAPPPAPAPAPPAAPSAGPSPSPSTKADEASEADDESDAADAGGATDEEQEP
jgi:tetratricopeptide (TPR) repeat protein